MLVGSTPRSGEVRASRCGLSYNFQMRQQYHFWPGNTGVDAWDVQRLIELSVDIEPIEVAVAGIAEVDTAYWFDLGTQMPTVRPAAIRAGETDAH